MHVAVLASKIKSSLVRGSLEVTEDFPEESDSRIISRYDTLAPLEQVTVKTASAIGLTFSFAELKHVLSGMDMGQCVDALNSTLCHLTENDLIEQADSDYYRFASLTVQKGIYNLMLSSQRETVHGVMAAYFETKYLRDEDYFKEIYHEIN